MVGPSELVECRLDEDEEVVAVILRLELPHKKPTPVTTGVQVHGNRGVQHVGSGTLYFPWAPLEFHLYRDRFENNTEVTLAVADRGYRPKASDWNTVDWTWKRRYQALMEEGRPKLIPV